MRSHAILIKEAELLASTPERVYQWLEARAIKRENYDEEGDHELEVALLGRNDPLIEIAIARFAKYEDTAKILFNRINIKNFNQSHQNAIRLALLSSESLSGLFNLEGVPSGLFDSKRQGVSTWLATADEIELRALFSNPRINDIFLRDILEGKEPWQVLDEDRRLAVIRTLAANKRMTQRYSGNMNGYAEYSHDSVTFAAWKLAETLPTSKKWAVVLGIFLEKLPYKSLKMDDPLAIADRWRSESHDVEDQNDEAGSAKSGYLWSYALVRKSLAGFAVSKNSELRKKLINSKDPAFRAAIYSSYEMTTEQIFSAYEMDGNLAVNECQRNDCIWRRPENRKAMHDISWKACGELNNNYMDSANTYNYLETERKNKFPQWFKDEEDEIDLAMTPATKLDIETLAETVGGNEYLLRETMTMHAQLGQALGAVNSRLGWVWWFSLGALATSLIRRL